MFNMKLLTLASLLIPTALTTPISTPSDSSVTTTTTTPPAAHVALPTFPLTIIGQYPPAPYPYPAGYLGPRAAAAAIPTATTSPFSPIGSTNTIAQLITHHLPDCLASDPAIPYILEAGVCYTLPISFLSYTACMAGPLPLAAGGKQEVCKVHVYSKGDCSGFENESKGLTEGLGKCTGTGLRVVDGLAGVGAVGVRVVCA